MGKNCGKRDSIHVAFDDGRKEVMNLKKYHLLMCPIDELCDEHAGVNLSREQILFWRRHEAQLLDSASAANLHQSIVEKYMRNAEKLKTDLPTQLRILELCCGSKSFANYLRVKFPRAIIVTLDIIDSAHPTHVAVFDLMVSKMSTVHGTNRPSTLINDTR
ncbi:predicted protein [Micromonas commoda]|uniref:Uncharacterized protein n=1 Tax=Micromonas commoda (strain RCC299 / NOUM17 / CCMP2709) TaxID=296587 RepID=C1EJN8_MICCC|nr:predicted protein [Micromonas commoda]ACO68220.1 predicted protein [Micromonas commoda]|eukprot:XP_002506962.1 predicted protein [Micromonas commoda]